MRFQAANQHIFDDGWKDHTAGYFTTGQLDVPKQGALARVLGHRKGAANEAAVLEGNIRIDFARIAVMKATKFAAIINLYHGNTLVILSLQLNNSPPA